MHMSPALGTALVLLGLGLVIRFFRLNSDYFRLALLGAFLIGLGLTILGVL